jgi:hypothetical protein
MLTYKETASSAIASNAFLVMSDVDLSPQPENTARATRNEEETDINDPAFMKCLEQSIRGRAIWDSPGPDIDYINPEGVYSKHLSPLVFADNTLPFE